jgi:hypothetical protein
MLALDDVQCGQHLAHGLPWHDKSAHVCHGPVGEWLCGVPGAWALGIRLKNFGFDKILTNICC